METCVSLGTNKGDLINNLKKARAEILQIEGTSLLACSPVYKTDPVDVPPKYAENYFLNAIIIISSNLSPEKLLENTNRIERCMGRTQKGGANLPRTIDIDLIYADHQTVAKENVRIPHPRWAERRFVVQPLADVRPNLILPGTNVTVAEQLSRLPQSPRVECFAQEW